MKPAEFDKVVKGTIESIQALLAVKGGEYSEATDRLSNFKMGGTAAGIAPEQDCIALMTKHWDAVCRKVRATVAGEELKISDSTFERLDDLINYCILLKALLIEREKTTR